VFDLPPMTVRVTEHQLIARRCACGAAIFSGDVDAALLLPIADHSGNGLLDLIGRQQGRRCHGAGAEPDVA